MGVISIDRNQFEIDSKKTLFQEGVVVRLTSGGPRMTVERITSPDDDCIGVVWFDGNKLMRDRLHVLGLVLASNDTGD